MSEVEAIHESNASMPSMAITEPKEESAHAIKRYKCHTCHIIIKEDQFIDESKKCPECGEPFAHLEVMCKLDHCHCTHDIMAGIAYCPECGKPVCPECMSHDIIQISRVTGYLQDVSGWNAGKQRELKDRHRYNAV